MSHPVMKLSLEITGGDDYVQIEGDLYRRVCVYHATALQEVDRLSNRTGHVAMGKGSTPDEAVNAALKQFCYFADPLAR